MFKLSIFDSRWTDIVFEGRNKDYGAYQLRAENGKTTIKALCIAVLFILAPTLLLSFKTKETVENIPDHIYPSITITKVEPYTVPLSEKKEASKKIKQKKTDPIIDRSNLIDPVITDQIDNLPQINTNDTMNIINSDNNPEGSDENIFSDGNTNGSGNTDNVTSSGNNTEGINTNTIHNTASVDKKPDFPGGMDNFYKYIVKNFKTSEDLDQKLIKMTVRFIIEKDGSISGITIIKNPGYGLDREATRVLNALTTKWQPGIIKGEPVRTVITLPISIRTE